MIGRMLAALNVAVLSLLATACSAPLKPGTPDDSTTLSSHVRISSPAMTTGAPAPSTSATETGAATTTSPNSAFCTELQAHHTVLASFPTTPQAAVGVRPLWASVVAHAPASVRGTLVGLQASVVLVAQGRAAQVDSTAVAANLRTASSWINQNCR